MTRLEKVAALLNSDEPGERAAALAAWERLQGKRDSTPVPGSPEWIAALAEHRRKIGFLSVHRTSPALSHAEVQEIRRLVHFGGTPWDRSAERVERLYQKLLSDAAPVEMKD